MTSNVQKQIVLPKSLATAVRSKTEASRTDSGTQIRNEDTSWATQDPRVLRASGRTTEAIRTLAKENGSLSTAVFDMVQIANSGFRVSAYLPSTNEFSDEGTILVNNIIASMDALYDYSKGFARKRPIPMLVQTLLRETALTGGCSIELALDKARLPDRFQAVDYSTLVWVSDGKGGKYPEQTGFGDPIKLDIATFYAESLHQELNTAYSVSIYRAALDDIFNSSEFISDMKRSVFKSGHSRLVVSLDDAKVRASASKKVQKSDTLLAAYMAQVKSSVEDALKDLAPEDAVVSYDSAKFDTQDIGAAKSDYVPLMKSLENKAATGLKTPASILGTTSGGSQNLSNTESLIFLKTAAALQTPVESIMSRALTTACRLYGSDVYVKFTFKEIDLRPESELEAFKTMKESRILQRLSLGLITDSQCAFELDLPYNPSAPTLSGTGFYEKSSKVSDAGDSGGAGDQLQPPAGVPRKAGGRSQ